MILRAFECAQGGHESVSSIYRAQGSGKKALKEKDGVTGVNVVVGREKRLFLLRWISLGRKRDRNFRQRQTAFWPNVSMLRCKWMGLAENIAKVRENIAPGCAAGRTETGGDQSCRRIENRGCGHGGSGLS